VLGCPATPSSPAVAVHLQDEGDEVRDVVPALKSEAKNVEAANSQDREGETTIKVQRKVARCCCSPLHACFLHHVQIHLLTLYVSSEQVANCILLRSLNSLKRVKGWDFAPALLPEWESIAMCRQAGGTDEIVFGRRAAFPGRIATALVRSQEPAGSAH